MKNGSVRCDCHETTAPYSVVTFECLKTVLASNNLFNTLVCSQVESASETDSSGSLPSSGSAETPADPLPDASPDSTPAPPSPSPLEKEDMMKRSLAASLGLSGDLMTELCGSADEEDKSKPPARNGAVRHVLCFLCVFVDDTRSEIF